jgi:mannan polymerase II complex MNN10 subunit
MLVRSARKIPPSLVLLLAFLVFLGWQLSQGPSHEEAPPPPPPPAPAPVEAEPKAHEEEKKPLRVAVVTFVTDQRSYLHLSLKNKDRKRSLVEPLHKHKLTWRLDRLLPTSRL